VIRRRQILYVEGYDPQGAEGYHNLFVRSWKRFLKIWPVRAKVSDLRIDSDDLAHWEIEAAGPNWQVATRYEFLRQEQMIRANMAEPLWRQVPRAIGWAFDYLIGGTLFRVFRASWQYGLALLFFQVALLLWIALSVVAGWLVASAAFRLAGVPEWLAIILGIGAAIGAFFALRPLANHFFTIQINSHWPYLLEYARGKPSCFDRPVEAGAARLLELVRANAADEILVIGHSGGGVLAPAVVARALELDPELGRRGPPVILFTLGSLMPGVAVHPQATRLHDIVRRLATEKSVLWVDAQSRKDVLNFWDFDPVEGIGVHVGSERCNPLIWKVRFRDMLSPEFYRRLRWHFFRMHYQFIMANDMRASYDYFMLVCGPAPAREWAAQSQAVLARFAEDTSYES
jgi:hypothetical protein